MLVLAVVLGAAYAGRQVSLTPGEQTPESTTEAAPAPVMVLDLRFEEDGDGTLRVLDARRGEVLRTLAPGEGGFMRGVMRPLRRERMRRDVAEEAPYHLARWGDGRLTLSDPGASLVLELAAFGETSVAAFAALLDGPAPAGDGGR